MDFKPTRDYSEHDVVNLFALNQATGSKATPVVIFNSGWNTNQQLLQSNTLVGNPSNVNIFSRKWVTDARVRVANSGEKPFGLTLYDVREVNQYGYPLIYDQQRAIELQAVTSGQQVPIVRKGIFHIGPWGTGAVDVPAPGKYLVVKSSAGDLAAVLPVSGVIPSGAFGEFLGTKDADGYVLTSINCYL